MTPLTTQQVTWLPRLWPENARFIATAIPCQSTIGGISSFFLESTEAPFSDLRRSPTLSLAQRFARLPHEIRIDGRNGDRLYLVSP